MPAAIDLTGLTVGRLTVLRLEHCAAKGRHARGYVCACDCGRTLWCASSRLSQSLKCGLMSSCGLCNMPVAGKTFGRLTVVSEVARKRGANRRQFECVCACGKRRTVDSASLVNGHTQSCGCSMQGRVVLARRKPDGFAAQSIVIGKYRLGARKRGYDYTLTREQAIELFVADCWYCGAAPARTLQKGHSGFAYNGIDRVDSSNGYVPGNVVSCCTECNYRKGSQTYNDFVRWVRAVAAHGFVDRPPPNGAPADPNQTGTRPVFNIGYRPLR